jgi:hypothetical protein
MDMRNINCERKVSAAALFICPARTVQVCRFKSLDVSSNNDGVRGRMMEG